MTDIFVVGSLNTDLVIEVPRFPQPGETITGEDLKTYSGGKGANQAVACARQGLKTSLLGKVGNDSFGDDLRSGLRKNQVDSSWVLDSEHHPTGSALISVAQGGENTIILSPGANNQLTPRDIESCAEYISQSKMVLLQLEIPLETVAAAIRLASQAGVPVILNPAPARKIPDQLFSQIEYLVPNETELALLSQIEVKDQKSREQAARILLDRGVSYLIITLGKDGALLVTQQTIEHIPGFEVDVVDTTAAGDSFIGGLAASLLRGQTLKNAVRYANACGALAATRAGAQPSIPSRDQVDAFLGNG